MSEAIAAWIQFEERTCRAWNRLSAIRVFRALFGAASRLGNGVFWYVLMGVLSVVDGAVGRETAIRMAAVGLTCTLVYKGVKLSIRRPRPLVVLSGLRTDVAPLDQFSFPSGHTMHACAFTVVACASYPLMAWALVPFTVIVALSRVVLGLHYASDVAAGALLGSALAYASLGIA